MSLQTKNQAPIMTSLESKMVCRGIKKLVESMLSYSKVMEGSLQERQESFGIFEKDEVRLGKLLGQGGFSDVYELEDYHPTPAKDAWYDETRVTTRHRFCDSTKKRRFAVKQLRTRCAEDGPMKLCLYAADLVMEAQYLSSLNHKNIIKIHGWSSRGINSFAQGRHDDYFLILDRLEGTLESRIESWQKEYTNDQTLSKQSRLLHMIRATDTAHQIASALQYLHSKNIVFRDLKPANIGFDEYGTVKIFDFGLARELPESSPNVNDVYKMSGNIGTARWMAPEVARQEAYNQKVDTYSWSMIYWNCLTLMLPYATMDRATHKHLVCEDGMRPFLPSDIPKCVQNLLEQSWDQQIETRLTAIEIVKRCELVEFELTREFDLSKVLVNPRKPRSSITRSILCCSFDVPFCGVMEMLAQ